MNCSIRTSTQNEAVKLTIEEFAKALGVTRKTVYNWMVHGNIPQSKLEKMAEMFDCSIDYLLQRSI